MRPCYRLLVGRPRTTTEAPLKRRRKTIRDIMSAPAITVELDTDLETAARTMLERDIGCLPVVDGDGRLAGIITTTDFGARRGSIPFSTFAAPRLLGEWLGPDGIEEVYRRARSLQAREVMSSPVHSVPVDAPLSDVLRVLLDHNIDQVVVVEDRRPIGIVSHRDLLRLMLDLEPRGPAP